VIGTDPALSETPPRSLKRISRLRSPPSGIVGKEEDQILILPFSQAQRETNLMNLAIQLWATAF
jgi:hypothetical protein